MDDSIVPYGYCHCGCGEKTRIAEQTRAARGWIRGEPKRFVAGHFYAYRRKQGELSIVGGKKTCSQCGAEWPATIEYFQASAKIASGFRSNCRRCQRQYALKRAATTDERERYKARNRAANKVRVFTGQPKTCVSCGAVHPGTPEFFKRDHGSPSGLRGMCRPCERDWHRRWSKTPQGRLSSRVSSLRRRQVEKTAKGDGFAREDLWQMLEDQGHLCCYCETPLFGEFHAEHLIPLSRGGVNDWTNIGIACPSCNLRKGAKTAVEFMMVLME